MKNKKLLSHQLLSMFIENRTKGSIGFFLDKLNQYVSEEQITEQQKKEIVNHLQDFFIEEHKIFQQFSDKIENTIGFKLDETSV